LVISSDTDIVIRLALMGAYDQVVVMILHKSHRAPVGQMIAGYIIEGFAIDQYYRLVQIITDNKIYITLSD
jgi:hypothetical protein